MPSDPPIEQQLEPTDLFNSDLRQDMVRIFGPDGAWLLLSSLWYGWRAHYDLACALVSGARPTLGEDPRPMEIDEEFQIVRDLQVQSSLFASAEQFATILRAAHRHTIGQEPFFEAYVGAPMQVSKLIANNARGLDQFVDPHR